MKPFDGLVPDDPLFDQPRLQKLVGKPKPVRESTIEKYLVDRVKALGGEIRKVEWVGRSGAPDRLVMLPARPWKPSKTQCTIARDQPARSVWVELKRPGKDAETHQLREHNKMRSFGMSVLLVDSKALVDLHFPLP